MGFDKKENKKKSTGYRVERSEGRDKATSGELDALWGVQHAAGSTWVSLATHSLSLPNTSVNANISVRV